jgi:hypothetical protein
MSWRWYGLATKKYQWLNPMKPLKKRRLNMRQLTFFALVLVLSLTIAPRESYAASGWSTPAPVAGLDDGPGSLTIDPSENWEMVYDSYDDQTNMASIKYFNSGSASPVTVVEYEECYDGPACSPGTIAEFDGLTSARDATGKLHVVYEIDWAPDRTSEVFYMYMDDNDPSVGADFIADVLSGPVPLPVNFTDQSCGPITSWQWNFGDGSISTEQNPSHTYSKPGTYTVSLAVTGPGGSDAETKTDFISVRAAMPWIPLLLLDD